VNLLTLPVPIKFSQKYYQRTY